MAVVAGRQRRPLPLGTAVSSRGGVPSAYGLSPSEAGAARRPPPQLTFASAKTFFASAKKYPRPQLRRGHDGKGV